MTAAQKPARDWLAWAALAAALVVTASAEYALARAAGFGEFTAAGVPAALDIYAVRALRARRDVAAVVVAMVAVNAAAHMVEAGLLEVSWPLVVGVSAIAPMVLWRVHRLADHAPEPVPEAEPRPAVVTARVRTRPVPAAVPVGVRLLPIVPVPAAVPELLAAVPESRTRAAAAEPARRTRVSAPVPATRTRAAAADVPELLDQARTRYAELLADGRTPSVRELRTAYSIGQVKATAIRDALA